MCLRAHAMLDNREFFLEGSPRSSKKPHNPPPRCRQLLAVRRSEALALACDSDLALLCKEHKHPSLTFHRKKNSSLLIAACAMEGEAWPAAVWDSAWLPGDVHARAVVEEPQSFKRAVDGFSMALQAVWTDAEDLEAWPNALAYLDPLKQCVLCCVGMDGRAGGGQDMVFMSCPCKRCVSLPFLPQEHTHSQPSPLPQLCISGQPHILHPPAPSPPIITSIAGWSPPRRRCRSPTSRASRGR
jgi:hypothetical protein